jgi:hypothetical protein
MPVRRLGRLLLEGRTSNLGRYREKVIRATRPLPRARRVTVVLASIDRQRAIRYASRGSLDRVFEPCSSRTIKGPRVRVTGPSASPRSTASSSQSRWRDVWILQAKPGHGASPSKVYLPFDHHRGRNGQARGWPEVVHPSSRGGRAPCSWPARNEPALQDLVGRGPSPKPGTHVIAASRVPTRRRSARGGRSQTRSGSTC